MSCRILSLETPKDRTAFLSELARRGELDTSRDDNVRVMLEEVRTKGDEALLSYTHRFDCPEMTPPLRISAEELAQAPVRVGQADMAVIRRAATNIREFHEAQRERSWFVTRPDGTILGQKVEPVDAAGMYVPGGRGGETPLISSLLMTVIPAQVAGVRRVAVVSPPRADGTLNPCILAAAHLLGVQEVYRVGGAWSIGALAYGTASIPKVDVIAGPGNSWVTAAKRLVQGTVGIDMIAGPSEICIIADANANPEWIAADMLSQAEHDTLASALCVTWDPELGAAVLRELNKQLRSLPRREVAEASLRDWSAVLVVRDMAAAVEMANAVAPEHLELLVAEPWAVLPRIRHAGAVFLGPYSPEPLGDYMAGPNHVLPTVGTARFSSALSVHTFMRRMSVISASPDFAQSHADDVARLARLEGLEAHARSMESRRH